MAFHRCKIIFRDLKAFRKGEKPFLRSKKAFYTSARPFLPEYKALPYHPGLFGAKFGFRYNSSNGRE